MFDDYVEILKKWAKFADEVTRNNRYYPKDEFLNQLNIFLPKCENVIPKGTIYYRARIFDIDDENMTDGKISEKTFFKRDEMGAPPNGKAGNGRANPEGISYLYLASDVDTAISEVRPWVGAYVCVAECMSKENLRIIDFFDALHKNNELEDTIINVLNNRFSLPVNPTKKIDYIPTQVAAEFIKQRGFDGIKYSSHLGIGENLVIFSKNKIEIKENIKKHSILALFYEHIEVQKNMRA